MNPVHTTEPTGTETSAKSTNSQEPQPDIYSSQEKAKLSNGYFNNSQLRQQSPNDKYWFLFLCAGMLFVVLSIFVFYKTGTHHHDSFLLFRVNLLAYPTMVGLLTLALYCFLRAFKNSENEKLLIAGVVLITFFGIVPPVIKYIATIRTDKAEIAFVRKQAAKVDYKLFLPQSSFYKSDIELRHFDEDGPLEPANYINPKTNTNNFGTVFEEPAFNTNARVTIYNKGYIPDEFQNCAPLYGARFADEFLQHIKKFDCQKLYTSARGAVIYYHQSGNNEYSMDIGNSRIVFVVPNGISNALIADTQTTYSGITHHDLKLIVPDTFKQYVDSFKEVDVHSLEFITQNGNGKIFHP